MLYRKNAFIALFIAIAFFKPALSYAQVSPGVIRNIISKIDTFYAHLPGEKIYLQFDKPYYAVGDTIWFKGYVLNAAFSYSPLSSRLYIELINDSNKVVKRMATPVDLGVTWGNIELLPGVIKGEPYTIRAYTNWARNFGDEAFFSQSFYIADAGAQKWMVNPNTVLAEAGGTTVAKVNAVFTNLDKSPLALHDMVLKVMDGQRILYKGASQTAADGTLAVNFNLPEAPVKNLCLLATDKSNSKLTASIPLDINRPKDVDVQFMPESGNMIAGIPAHMGFKAIGEDGLGADVTGVIVNAASGNEISSFQSAYKGMGTLELLPEAGVSYVAKVKLPGGQIKEVPLPAVKSSGAVLHVRNAMNKDTMDVSIYLSDEQVKQNTPLYLIGQSREVVCFAATIPPGVPLLSVRVAKGLFPTGIAHFTLLNSNSQPLNERLVFIDHHDNLKIGVDAGQQSFMPRDSIPLKITVYDDAGKPVVGSFSLSVTDDSQVKGDSANAASILSRLLLTAGLKGNVEGPGYYFSENKGAWAALDALLLTQGWTGYDWKSINNEPKPLFGPEYTHMVKGKVTNLLNKPMPGADVVLVAAGKYRFVRDTLTNAQGVFTFNKIPPVDSTTFVLEAKNGKTKKAINAGISIDEIDPPGVKGFNYIQAFPWYVNSNSTVLNFVNSNIGYQKELDSIKYGVNGRALRQVDIRDRAIVRGSDNLNGAGNADQVIDEDDVVKAGKMSLYDLILKKVTGFREVTTHKTNNIDFLIKDKKVRFVFDGVDIARFFEPITGQPDEYYFYVKQYLDYFTAEDIRGIEVLYNIRYNARYNSYNLENADQLTVDAAGTRGADFAYLEITTRAGNGPFMKKATAIYVYKPSPTTLAGKFYRPRYPVKSNGKNFNDLRSTIHWQPNIVTNKSGGALVSFYAADKPGTYTITLDGSDLNGKIGHATQKITISPGTKQ